jgi:hypothetical protein
LGDAWLWSRKNSTVNIAPLVAATLAVWAFVSSSVVGEFDLLMGLRTILTRPLAPGLPGVSVPEVAMRTVEPLEGTNISLFNTIIPNWWAENGLSSTASWSPGGAELAQRVWVANRCQQLNAQQIASMPLEFHGPDGAEPAWMSSPDPHWYPNGIGDAMHAIVDQLYGWGFSCQYVTDFYADGFPRTWTVLPSAAVNIEMRDGNRVQARRGNPRPATGRADRPQPGPEPARQLGVARVRADGVGSAGRREPVDVGQPGRHPAGCAEVDGRRRLRRLEALQDQWMAATMRRNGAPPVLPPDVAFEVLSFNPSDMSLLETQEFNAKAIATAYGVPSVLLNMAMQGGLTYQNPAALGEMWWRFELRPTATRVANAFSAQMLPRGQWVSFDAADTFLALDAMSDENDEQASQVAKATPASQPRPLTAIGGGG